MRRRADYAVNGVMQIRLPAVREDRGRFAALRRKRVLIYWPHGFGDWVTFGAVAPLLEPTVTDWAEDALAPLAASPRYCATML